LDISVYLNLYSNRSFAGRAQFQMRSSLVRLMRCDHFDSSMVSRIASRGGVVNVYNQ